MSLIPNPRTLFLLVVMTSQLLHICNCAAEDDALRFGITSPLTGDYASAGEEIKRGANLAQVALRGRGVALDLKFEDACLPSQGVAAYKKLTEVDKVHALVSNYCLISLNAMVPLITNRRLLLFQNSISPRSLIAKSRDVFTTWPSIEEEVAASVRSLPVSELRRSALLYLESPWGIAFAEAFRGQLKEHGISPILDASQSYTVHDFRVELTKMAKFNPSVVLFAHTGTNMVSFLKQAHTARIPSSRIIVPSDAEDLDLINSAGKAAEGVTLFSTEGPTPSPGRLEFERAYTATYGRAPAPLGRHAYDQTIIAAEALTACKRDLTCAEDRIMRISQYDGASGIFSFSQTRLASRPLFRKKVANNHFVAAP